MNFKKIVRKDDNIIAHGEMQSGLYLPLRMKIIQENRREMLFSEEYINATTGKGGKNGKNKNGFENNS